MVTVRPRKRIPLLLAALLALQAPPARTVEPPPLVVPKWLALDPVDRRGRVPFNASAPLLRYLLDRAAPPPKEGEKVKGDLAEAPWRAVGAKEDGTVEDESGACFYGEIALPPSPAALVHLCFLDGASTLFINGAAFPGDVYRIGTGPVPVALEGGVNRLFVLGPRGPWRLRFEPWTGGRSPLLREDATLPDIVEGADAFSEMVSFRIVNPSLSWQAVGSIVEGNPPPPDGPIPVAMPPLWTGLATGVIGFPRGVGTKGPVRFGVTPWAGKEEWPAQSFDLEIRKPEEARRITFTSRIDGSVQYYGMLPPAKSDLAPGRVVTVLSLHGAGVDALDQARAYAPKTDFRIVAPTNRRPYGFDWQDWGREDGYEALADAFRRFGGDGARTCLTGHSMGGHGVWHLAANDPDRWLAIAPSAGWCSFATYPGAAAADTPLSPIWRGADGGSRTEDLIANLAPVPTFVLHGTKDDTVPLAEAEGMLNRLEAAGGKPLHHFQEGAGHWWDGDPAPGAACVDWPGIFALFRDPPGGRDATAIGFTTLDPALRSGRGWLEVLQPLLYGQPVAVRGTMTGLTATITTTNVRLLRVSGPARNAPLRRCTVDGTEVPVPADASGVLAVRGEAGWRGGDLPPPQEKAPGRAGPFKRAFGNRFVLVVGTKGTDGENRESMELARFHAESWWYRANGDAPVVRDTDLLADEAGYAGRNLVLYGNADTNAAWTRAAAGDSPVMVRRGALSVGDREWKGEGLGAVFIRPRPEGGLAGFFGSTGARGTRVGYGLLPFVSGVGYPDFAVYGEEFLRSGDGGVLAAGWFDHLWGLQPGYFLRGDGK